MELILRQTVSSFRNKGFGKTVFLIIKNILLGFSHWSERRFDRVRNVSTAGVIPIASLSTLSDSSFSEDYVPTPISIIRRSIESIPQDLREFDFIDVGSGKGRVLFKACEYNFKRVVGVEFSDRLHAQCVENIRQLNPSYKKTPHIDAVHADILNYELPDENLVIFMFNPFREEVVKKFVQKIEEHLRTYGKKIYIIYYNPKYGHCLQEAQFLKSFHYEEPLIYLSIRQVLPVAMFESV